MTNKRLLQLYTGMLRIRMVEEAIAECYINKEITMYTHLYIGQEAIAAGVCANIRKGDYVFSNHRSHGHYIASGGSLKSLFAELLGRSTGCSKGKGGSMHLVDAQAGYMGSSSIVAGNIPIAVGTAMALKADRSKNITICLFGDGAVDEGVFYESLNFAALKNLPVLFICENNFYAICSHQSKRQKLDNIHKKARAFGVPGERVDGNNVVKVYNESKRIMRAMRKGAGPYLIECRTYRWMGHAGPQEDIDLGYRSKEELDFWKARCPIKTLERILFTKKVINKTSSAQIRAAVAKEIKRVLLFARKSPFPERCDLLEGITSKNTIAI